MRRVLRELVENATHDQVNKEVAVPTTIEDKEAVGLARAKVEEYFRLKGKDVHKPAEARAKL